MCTSYPNRYDTVSESFSHSFYFLEIKMEIHKNEKNSEILSFLQFDRSYFSEKKQNPRCLIL